MRRKRRRGGCGRGGVDGGRRIGRGHHRHSPANCSHPLTTPPELHLLYVAAHSSTPPHPPTPHHLATFHAPPTPFDLPTRHCPYPPPPPASSRCADSHRVTATLPRHVSPLPHPRRHPFHPSRQLHHHRHHRATSAYIVLHPTAYNRRTLSPPRTRFTQFQHASSPATPPHSQLLLHLRPPRPQRTTRAIRRQPRPTSTATSR